MHSSLEKDSPDAPEPFDEAPLPSRAAKSAMLVGGAQLCRLLFITLGTIIVSRILKPEDYGIIAMVAPITGFIVMFQDVGLSQAVIQANNITYSKLNSLFWVNIIATLAIMIILVICAPLVAIFYSDPRPGYITAASAIIVLFGGFSLQHSALLSRKMRFGAISIADISSAFATLAATIVAALILRNYWALWIGMLTGSITNTLILWRAESWRPKLEIKFTNIGSEMKFGSNLTGFNLLNFLCRNLDNVLIAHYFGPKQLGLYDRSYRLMMLPLEMISGPLSRVMMPVLQRLRTSPAGYRTAYLSAVRIMLLVATPIVAVTASTSDHLIVFLLGDQWKEAGSIFFWLSLTGLIQPIASATGWLFISNHRTPTMLRWGLFSSVLIICGFAIGLKWGATGIAASLFFTTVIRLPILFPLCVRGTSVTATDHYLLLMSSLLNATITFLITRLLVSELKFATALLISTILSYVISLILTSIRKEDRELLSRLWKMAVSAVRSRRYRQSTAR